MRVVPLRLSVAVAIAGFFEDIQKCHIALPEIGRFWFHQVRWDIQ